MNSNESKRLKAAGDRVGLLQDLITEKLLTNDIELAKGIGQLAESVNQAIVILSRAILELDDAEDGPRLRIRTRNAVKALAETENEA